MQQGEIYTLFTKFPDQTRFYRTTPDGHQTNRKAHAAMMTRDQAQTALEATARFDPSIITKIEVF